MANRIRDDLDFRTHIEKELDGTADNGLVNSYFSVEDDGFLAYLKHLHHVKKPPQRFLDSKMSTVVDCASRAMDLEKSEALLNNLRFAQDQEPSITVHDVMQYYKIDGIPSALFEGKFITNMRFRALLSLIDEIGAPILEKKLHSVPVVMVTSDTLDAFTIMSPLRHPCIVMNTWISFYFPILMISLYVLSGLAATRKTLPGWQHDPLEHAMTIMLLAQAVNESNALLMRYSKTLADMPILYDWSSQMTSCVEDFVLLHEYGHLFDGHHLGSAPIASRLFSELAQSPEMVQELYADAFASSVFKNHPSQARGSLLAVDSVAAILVLFQFMALCNALHDGPADAPKDRTHPPVQVRWELIAEKLCSGIDDLTPMHQLQEPFMHLIKMVDGFRAFLKEG